MKTAIVYISTHHGNTKKLAEGIRDSIENVDLFDLQEVTPDLRGYDCIGLASGIYAGKVSPELVTFVKTHLPNNKYVFGLYTYGGKDGKKYTLKLKEAVAAVGGIYLQDFGCKGYNTFGPFKLMGGTAKGHPTAEDLNNAAAFVKKILTVLEKQQ